MLKGVSIAGVKMSAEVIDDYSSQKESLFQELRSSA